MNHSKITFLHFLFSYHILAGLIHSSINKNRIKIFNITLQNYLKNLFQKSKSILFYFEELKIRARKNKNSQNRINSFQKPRNLFLLRSSKNKIIPNIEKLSTHNFNCSSLVSKKSSIARKLPRLVPLIREHVSIRALLFYLPLPIHGNENDSPADTIHSSMAAGSSKRVSFSKFSSTFSKLSTVNTESDRSSEPSLIKSKERLKDSWIQFKHTVRLPVTVSRETLSKSSMQR